MSWKSETGCCLRSVLEGIFCLSVGSLLCAGLFLLGNIPAQIMVIVMHVLWTVSAFCAGRRAGLHRRIHGIRTGFLCALLLCILLYSGCVFLHEQLSVRMLVRSVFMLMAGMTGGVIGVNTRLKKPPY